MTGAAGTAVGPSARDLRLPLAALARVPDGVPPVQIATAVIRQKSEQSMPSVGSYSPIRTLRGTSPAAMQARQQACVPAAVVSVHLPDVDTELDNPGEFSPRSARSQAGAEDPAWGQVEQLAEEMLAQKDKIQEIREVVRRLRFVAEEQSTPSAVPDDSACSSDEEEGLRAELERRRATQRELQEQILAAREEAAQLRRTLEELPDADGDMEKLRRQLKQVRADIGHHGVVSAKERHVQKIRGLLALWDETDSTCAAVEEVFTKTVGDAEGKLAWNSGKILGFIRAVFSACNTTMPDFPANVWYDLYRNADTDGDMALNMLEATTFARSCLETSLDTATSRSPVRKVVPPSSRAPSVAPPSSSSVVFAASKAASRASRSYSVGPGAASPKTARTPAARFITDMVASPSRPLQSPKMPQSPTGSVMVLSRQPTTRRSAKSAVIPGSQSAIVPTPRPGSVAISSPLGSSRFVVPPSMAVEYSPRMPARLTNSIFTTPWQPGEQPVIPQGVRTTPVPADGTSRSVSPTRSPTRARQLFAQAQTQAQAAPPRTMSMSQSMKGLHVPEMPGTVSMPRSSAAWRANSMDRQVMVAGGPAASQPTGARTVAVPPPRTLAAVPATRQPPLLERQVLLNAAWPATPSSAGSPISHTRALWEYGAAPATEPLHHAGVQAFGVGVPAKRQPVPRSRKSV